MRVGFTIAFNAKHHFEHNDYAEYLAKEVFDYWVIVEGPAGNAGSTAWCRKIHERWTNSDGNSVDGTLEYLEGLASRHTNVSVISSSFWTSKDHMVNAALADIAVYTDNLSEDVFLWEIDADEQWTAEDLSGAEDLLNATKTDCGEFLADYYVGKDLLAVGEWGEGKKIPYRRLWRWQGQMFESHEPPKLCGGNGKAILLPQRFKHYAYYFPQDVRFKEEFYTGHENIFDRWKEIQDYSKDEFPLHISALITGSWGQTNTEIVKI